MSDPKRPNIYLCPHIDTCVFPIDEAHFSANCREFSATAKYPQYEQCQGYLQMNDLPRQWNKRVYKQTQDIGQSKSRYRV